MTPLLALDPGPEETAFALLDGGRLQQFGKIPNIAILPMLRPLFAATAVCEMIASYGMPVGQEVFETCVWIGEFRQRCRETSLPWHTLTRSEVKQALCGRTAGVNDPVIRQRLIDLYGPGKERAVGTKKAPGPLYGVARDVWAAIAVGKAWGKLPIYSDTTRNA